MQEKLKVYVLLLYRAMLSSPIAGSTIAAVVTPHYLAVVCYKVAAVLGLMQIHLPNDKHHWIGFAVSFQ